MKVPLKGRQQTVEAQGRLRERQPVAIIDIGSNSVRQVIYEGLSRSPSILFNEKILCGLGQGVAETGQLDEKAAERAIAAIKRFRQLSTQVEVGELHVLATAAVREAKNGSGFIKTVEKTCGTKVQLLSGQMEAWYAGLGVTSGFHNPDGIAGDLGGGSMELIPVNSKAKSGVTTPLGGLSLQEASGGNIKEAQKIAKREIGKVKIKWPGKSKCFYTIGGTWRALARLYMFSVDYPLDVVHGYTVKAKEYIEFCECVAKDDLDSFKGIEEISKNRRSLLPFAAVVLAQVLEHLDAREVSTSATGLREGFLYSLLDEETGNQDALIEATAELAILRARSPQHSIELADWTSRAFKILELEETKSQERWRKAACNLADIAWRSVSDFRAEQTLGIINNAGFNSISHEGRAYIAIVNFHRHQGLGSKKHPPEIASLASEDTVKKARILAAFFRVLYLFSASVEDILPRIVLERESGKDLVLNIPSDMASLAGERPLTRLEQLSREIGEEITLRVD